jgi:hypothetical protein
MLTPASPTPDLNLVNIDRFYADQNGGTCPQTTQIYADWNTNSEITFTDNRVSMVFSPRGLGSQAPFDARNTQVLRARLAVPRLNHDLTTMVAGMHASEQ